jgi:4,5-DOPA dioxygenase extradiol
LDWGRAKEEQEAGEDWAGAFDDWLYSQLTEWNTEELFRYEERAPHARRAVPTAEHFVPLLIAMGAGDEKRQAERLYRSFQFGTLCLECWKFL